MEEDDNYMNDDKHVRQERNNALDVDDVDAMERYDIDSVDDDNHRQRLPQFCCFLCLRMQSVGNARGKQPCQSQRIAGKL